MERAAHNGVDVFRVFDALNDVRNLQAAMEAVRETGRHAQGTLAYTVSPVHTLETWLDMGKRLEDMGADSLCIKDMAGLLRPYDGYELVAGLKESVAIPIHMQCHATTGLSTATYLKCIEAGIDNVDSAVSSMSMTYGHSATESLVAILEGTGRDTGLDIHLLEEIAAYFREVRKKYARFEGSLRGVDSRILVAQVPGGMLTNLENQLREQNAEDKLDQVMEEIPRVREDLGYVPLVTPTSQIVGTQAVLNVLAGERYKNLSRETRALLRGEYGATPAPVNAPLQQQALEGEEPVTGRPADRLDPEMGSLAEEVESWAKQEGVELAEDSNKVDDVLTCALFPKAGRYFLKHRGDADAFEPPPDRMARPPATDDGEAVYTVTVEGRQYTVTVASGGDISGIVPVHRDDESSSRTAASEKGGGEPVRAPMAGQILEVLVKPGQAVAEGEQLFLLEAMKMENAVSAPRGGSVSEVAVTEGAKVASGDLLARIR